MEIESESPVTTVAAIVPVPPSSSVVEDLRHLAYSIIKDVEAYPAYMPSVNAVEILNRSGNTMTTRWDAEIEGAPICWTQRIQTDEVAQEILFEAIEGDFDIFRGKWFVSESGGALFLNLQVEYTLGIPIIEAVLGPILKEKIRANSERMLQAIADRLVIPDTPTVSDERP